MTEARFSGKDTKNDGKSWKIRIFDEVNQLYHHFLMGKSTINHHFQ